MNKDLEFIRGNQKNFIRLSVEDDVLHMYEFRMCMNNAIKSFLPFQKRTQNGQTYIYYDVSGTQSLDVYAQTQKLKRPFLILFAKELLKLCKNISEYMLSFEDIVFDAKFIMYKIETQEMQFVYAFSKMQKTIDGLGNLLEFCVEYLDYSDRKLSDCVFQLYEHLQDQGENFSLENEIKTFIRLLEEQEQSIEEIEEKVPVVQVIEPFETTTTTKEPKYEEDIFVTSNRKGKRGILLLLCADVLGAFVWKPLTVLKLCFFFSFGLCLLTLYIYVTRKEKTNREKAKMQKESQEKVYMKEYETIAAQCNDEEGTQFIAIEHMSGVLYNLQGISPQYIYITEKTQLIGKDKEKVQICILADGISRVHASIVKKGDECILEDLCSTNGTWVNRKNIGVRVPYVLKEGDHICFAATEYIFR